MAVLLRWLVAAGALWCAACVDDAHDLGAAHGKNDAGAHVERTGEDGGPRRTNDSADGGQTAVPPGPPIDVEFTEVGLEAGLDYRQAPVGTDVGCEDLPPGKCGFSSIHMSGGAAA